MRLTRTPCRERPGFLAAEFLTHGEKMNREVVRVAGMVQSEVERRINEAIEKAIAYEAKRDAAEFESRLYWLHHDSAVWWHEHARSMMPKGS